jgi:hypothetical protein
MSLLSERVSTVLASPNIVLENLVPAVLPGVVGVSTADFVVTTSGAEPDVEYRVPLTTPIPQTAVVFSVIINTVAGFTSENGNNAQLAFGFQTPDYYDNFITASPWTTGSWESVNDALSIVTPTNTVVFKPTISKLIAGHTTVRILFA